MTFAHKLDSIIVQNNSLLCIGLDSDLKKIPKHIQNHRTPQFTFNKEIIDATHDFVCSYKPNSAFYEARGADGVEELKMTCDYLLTTYPKIPIILDAKRADTGSSNEGYVTYAFDYLGVDAITLHPYLGREALEPFFERKGKGCFILCRTSNPGAGELQDLKTSGKPLYQVIAEKVAKEWNYNGNCMLVVGATYPEELLEVRKIVGDMTILVPGVGEQGADLEKTLKVGLNSCKSGMIINSSRSIIFASQKDNFATESRKCGKILRDAINQYR